VCEIDSGEEEEEGLDYSMDSEELVYILMFRMNCGFFFVNFPTWRAASVRVLEILEYETIRYYCMRS
jgi:hypothetical protein